ncbi:signal peptidase I SipW [Peribacillus sp. NPDC097675]|uniref:signal peptidase I SipW n=1 Tax=Peribacillus sp. NPDC097675 TaxID=3390618 RepID=UPI003D084A90
MKRTLKVISNLITFVLFLNLMVMVFLIISSKASGGEPQVFGYQLKTVLSGSMEPTFQTGSVIAVKPLNSDEKKVLKKEDIITFQTSDGILITHRITKVNNSGEHVLYETKGDNNKTSDADPILSDNVVALYSGFTIPYIGYFIDFTQSKEGAALLLIGPGLLLLGYSGFCIYQGLREIESPEKLAAKKKIV